MKNLRVVSDNPADRSALSASSTAGLLVVSNLVNDRKSSVWRSIGTTATLTGTSPVGELAACVHLLFSNLSPTATVRVRLYSDTAGASLVLDTGTVLACPAPAIVLRGWAAAAVASAYAYGGGSHARVWFAPTTWKRFLIDLVDVNNQQGYLEAARLLVAPYWSPAKNASYGASLQRNDLSKHYRNDAGDLMTDAGTSSRGMKVSLDHMNAADRATFLSIVTGSGLAYPIFLSLFPESSDLQLERDHSIYGKLSDNAAIVLASMGTYASSIELEEI